MMVSRFRDLVHAAIEEVWLLALGDECGWRYTVRMLWGNSLNRIDIHQPDQQRLGAHWDRSPLVILSHHGDMRKRQRRERERERERERKRKRKRKGERKRERERERYIYI